MNEFYKIHIDKMKKNIFGNTQIYRPTYPLNFIYETGQNDEVWLMDLPGTVEKEIRYLIYIYTKIQKHYEKHRNIDVELYCRLISCEFEHFLLRVPIILDILNKHFLKTMGSDINDINEIVPLFEDLVKIKKIRNEFIHYNARVNIKIKDNLLLFTYVFQRNKFEEFKPSNTFEDEAFYNYFRVSDFTTILLCLVLNYLEEFFVESEKIRNNNVLPPANIVNEIETNDKKLNYPYSRIEMFFEELIIFESNLEKIKL